MSETQPKPPDVVARSFDADWAKIRACPHTDISVIYDDQVYFDRAAVLWVSKCRCGVRMSACVSTDATEP